MRFTLAHEFKFIASDQFHQCIGNGPEKACGAMTGSMKIDVIALNILIPLQSRQRMPFLKDPVNGIQINCNRVHCCVHNCP